MRRGDTESYRDPRDGGALTLEAGGDGDHVGDGVFRALDGLAYPISDGVPDFIFPRSLGPDDDEIRAVYDGVADVYDAYIHLTFDTFRTTEEEERRRMVSRLALKPGDRVLEFGAGTGRTLRYLSEATGPSGRIFVQELSPAMLAKAAEKAAGIDTPAALSLANGCYLPFADNSFDAVFHFGGVNMFSDIGRCFHEAARVTRPGGRVVIGDENMPVWLRETEMGRILMNSNRHYRCPVPFQHLPVSARDVACEWIIGGVFYLLSFRVEEGPPYADLDFAIPGARGGTHRTRYYGNLEGVSAEAKAQAEAAARRAGLSMHAWLDRTVRAAAEKET